MKFFRLLQQIVFVLIASILLCSCARKYLSLFRAELDSKTFDRDRVNVSNQFDFIIVSVEIKGKTHRFIFDTGAQVSLVTSNLAKQVQIENAGEIKVNDSQGVSSKLYFGIIDSLGIGNVHFSDIGVAIVKQGEGIANYFACMNVDGILGMNVIRLCNWKINYDNNTLSTIQLDSTLIRKNTINIPFEIQKGVPKTNWYVNGTKMLFTMDTGKNGVEIGVPIGHYCSQPIRKTIGYASFGLHGKTTSDTTATIICNISDSAEFHLKNVVFEQSTNNQTLVGNGFFKTYFSSLTFDFKNNVMRAVKREQPNRQVFVYPFTPMQTGDLLRIASIDSQQKKINIGDTIVGINKLNDKKNTNCEMLNFYMTALENKQSILLKTRHNGMIQSFAFQALPIKKHQNESVSD